MKAREKVYIFHIFSVISRLNRVSKLDTIYKQPIYS